MSGAETLRVLQILAGAEHGGAELYFVRQTEALAEAGVQQQAVIRDHARARAHLQAAGIPVTLARFGGPLDLATRRRIRAVATAFRPQIVLTYMSRATKKTPRGPYALVARLGGYYDLKYYRHCDHLIGNTPDLVDYFAREGWPRERATLIPNFVDDRPGPPAARSDWATPEGAPLIVAVGRLHRNKAFDTLIQAVARLPGAYLWIAGEGPERAALERLAAEVALAERLRLLGWQEDPTPFVRAADVYVVPSRHEPFGSVVLEGWMAGRPLVAAASQGPSWLIEPDKTGMLVPVDAPAALAEAMTVLLADREKAERLAAAGRAAFEARFTKEAIVAQYLTLFRRLAAERKGD